MKFQDRCKIAVPHRIILERTLVSIFQKVDSKHFTFVDDLAADYHKFCKTHETRRYCRQSINGLA